MAITPSEAGQFADEKKKLTPEELQQANEVEAQIDLHVKRSYDGTGKVVVSIQRPVPRVVSELERRFSKAGWNFLANSGENGRAGQGFSITLSTGPTSR
jgi:hypothetical protein